MTARPTTVGWTCSLARCLRVVLPEEATGPPACVAGRQPDEAVQDSPTVTTLAAALSSKAADRWGQVLLLPGLFFTATLAIGLLSGQRRALSLPSLAA